MALPAMRKWNTYASTPIGIESILELPAIWVNPSDGAGIPCRLLLGYLSASRLLSYYYIVPWILCFHGTHLTNTVAIIACFLLY